VQREGSTVTVLRRAGGGGERNIDQGIGQLDARF